jgi:hypothetical protein
MVIDFLRNTVPLARGAGTQARRWYSIGISTSGAIFSFEGEKRPALAESAEYHRCAGLPAPWARGTMLQNSVTAAPPF